MNPTNSYRPGFISVEDAIALIKADKRDDATVDLQFLANNLPYLRTKGIYNIRRMRTDEKGHAVRDGSSYVTIHTEYDRQILLKAIQDAFEERTKIHLNVENIGLNKVTTVVDEENNNTTGQPRMNESSDINKGDSIKSYSQTVQGV